MRLSETERRTLLRIINTEIRQSKTFGERYKKLLDIKRNLDQAKLTNERLPFPDRRK